MKFVTLLGMLALLGCTNQSGMTTNNSKDLSEISSYSANATKFGEDEPIDPVKKSVYSLNEMHGMLKNYTDKDLGPLSFRYRFGQSSRDTKCVINESDMSNDVTVKIDAETDGTYFYSVPKMNMVCDRWLNDEDWKYQFYSTINFGFEGEKNTQFLFYLDKEEGNELNRMLGLEANKIYLYPFTSYDVHIKLVAPAGVDFQKAIEKFRHLNYDIEFLMPNEKEIRYSREGELYNSQSRNVFGHKNKGEITEDNYFEVKTSAADFLIGLATNQDFGPNPIIRAKLVISTSYDNVLYETEESFPIKNFPDSFKDITVYLK